MEPSTPPNRSSAKKHVDAPPRASKRPAGVATRVSKRRAAPPPPPSSANTLVVPSSDAVDALNARIRADRTSLAHALRAHDLPSSSPRRYTHWTLTPSESPLSRPRLATTTTTTTFWSGSFVADDENDDVARAIEASLHTRRELAKATIVIDGSTPPPRTSAATFTCIACTDAPVAVLFTQCSHLCLCEPCATKLHKQECPLCRTAGPLKRIHAS